MPEGKRPDPKMMRRKVIALLEADLATAGFDLLDIRIFQGGGRYQVRVFVDLLAGPDGDSPADDDGPRPGISLDEVAKASRTTGMLLEEADLFADQYVIEVSSPGIRRPLRTPEHFGRAVGEKIDLKTIGAGRVRGVLRAVDGEDLVIEPPADGEAAVETVSVRLGQVVEANLDPEFDVQAIINADRRERKDARRLERAQKKGRKKKGRPKNRTKDQPDADKGSATD